MNDLSEITKQAETDVQEREALVTSADARLAAAQADAAAARASLEEARIVLSWLRRHSDPEPDAASPVSQNGQSRPAMLFGKPVPEGPTKLDRCLRALEGLGGSASNKAISSRVTRDGGPEIGPDHVRGLMKYASTKKPHPLVTTEPGSGVWRLVRSLNGTGGEL